MVGAMVFLLIIYLAIILLMLISMWKIYTKANKPGWTSLIPIYNVIVLLEIVKKPWWWLFLMLIPLINIIFYIIVTHRLSLSFGKGVGFTLGLIFLPFIFFPILAFDGSTYTPLQD